MTSPEDAALVLVGPMGAGKTSIGKRVARALRVPFVDTDALIVRAHGPIPELFTAHGEDAFRAIEREVVVGALAGPGVVSLGGGAVLDPRTRSDLHAHRVALLTVSPGIVASRLRGTQRPLLAGEDPLARWERIFAERRPLYEEVADATFDTSSGPLSHVVTAITAWMRDAEAAPAETGHAGDGSESG